LPLCHCYLYAPEGGGHAREKGPSHAGVAESTRAAGGLFELVDQHELGDVNGEKDELGDAISREDREGLIAPVGQRALDLTGIVAVDDSDAVREVNAVLCGEAAAGEDESADVGRGELNRDAGRN